MNNASYNGGWVFAYLLDNMVGSKYIDEIYDEKVKAWRMQIYVAEFE